MKRVFAKKIFLFVFLLIVFGIWLAGQRSLGKGRLEGSVSDESGNPIPNVIITLKSVKIPYKNREKFIPMPFKGRATSNRRGIWKMSGLGTGLCLVEATAPGFQLHIKEVFVSQLYQNPRVNFILKKKKQPITIVKDEEFFRFFEEGNRLFNEGKYSEAIASYKSCLGKNPQAYKIHYYIGKCYMEMNEIELGQEEYEKVILGAKLEESPESAEAQAEASFLLGELSAKRKDKEAALKYFMRSLELYPQSEIYAYNVGDVCFSLRKIEEAIHYFTLASEIKPSWPDPYMKLGYLYFHKADYQKAKESFGKFLELAPEHPQAKNIKEALERLKK